MARATIDRPVPGIESVSAVVGLIAVITGLAWATMAPGWFMFLPLGLLSLLLVAGGALLIVSGLFGKIGGDALMGTLWLVLVVVSAIVAVLVVLSLEVF